MRYDEPRLDQYMLVKAFGGRAWSVGRFVILGNLGQFFSIVVRFVCRSSFVVCRFSLCDVTRCVNLVTSHSLLLTFFLSLSLSLSLSSPCLDPW